MNNNLTAAEHHQLLRKQCWIESAASVASASNCHDSYTAINWADKILKAFDERFESPTITIKEN